MTAKTRLLASDLTTPGLLDPAAAASALCLPDATANPQAREARLPRDAYVQVVDIEDLSRSRWDQAEELESVERGERTRGREVIRLLPVGGAGAEGGEEEVVATPAARQGGDAGGGPSRNATHRLVLQDCKGQKVFALELTRVPRIGVGSLHIGEKILLRKGTVVARGTIMLEPSTCQILGGKVEAWQKAWVEGRLARLKEAVGAGEAD